MPDPKSMADLISFPILNAATLPNPFRVTSDLPAGAGIDFAKHFCTLFQRELADRFYPPVYPQAKEKDHGI